MADKKVATVIKLQIPAGQANPGTPRGSRPWCCPG